MLAPPKTGGLFAFNVKGGKVAVGGTNVDGGGAAPKRLVRPVAGGAVVDRGNSGLTGGVTSFSDGFPKKLGEDEDAAGCIPRPKGNVVAPAGFVGPGGTAGAKTGVLGTGPGEDIVESSGGVFGRLFAGP